MNPSVPGAAAKEELLPSISVATIPGAAEDDRFPLAPVQSAGLS